MNRIDEVWLESQRLSEMLASFNMELHQTANNIVQKLKQDPESVIGYAFTGWVQQLIHKLTLAAQMQP
jgi:hypothetical protein